MAESVAGDRAAVQTILEDGRDERLPVEYRLAHRQRRWWVVDVVLDGVSLAESYRAQFNRIIRKSSYDALILKMRSKVR